jgi:hypothetical protein
MVLFLNIAFVFVMMYTIIVDMTNWSLLYLCRYPIYRIPTGPTLKDLDACFLTYHSLYTRVGVKKEFTEKLHLINQLTGYIGESRMQNIS